MCTHLSIQFDLWLIDELMTSCDPVATTTIKISNLTITPRSPLYPFPISNSLTARQPRIAVYYCRVDWPFLEFHTRVERTQVMCIFFSLASFTQHNDLEIYLCCCICQRFIHFFVVVCVSYNLFIHSSFDGDVGFWQFHAIMNKAAVNFTHDFSCDTLEMNCRGITVGMWLRNRQTVFQSSSTIPQSLPKMPESSCCSASASTSGFVSINYSHPRGRAVIFTCISLSHWCRASS